MYTWDLGANWGHVVYLESNRNATEAGNTHKVKLVESNDVSEPSNDEDY